MDLTQFNGGEAFDTANSNGSGGSSLEPGRYTLHYAGSDMIEGKNNWKALKMLFEVDGTTINVSNTFTMGSDNPKAVDIGQNSLMLFMNAVGLNSMKNTDQLVGKAVSAELVRAGKPMQIVRIEGENRFAKDVAAKDANSIPVDLSNRSQALGFMENILRVERDQAIKLYDTYYK